MRTPVFLFLVSAFTVFNSSCHSTNNPGGKIWFYAYTADKPEGETNSLSTASFLNLQANGDYTSDLNGFDFGTWIYQDKILLIDSKRKGRYSINVPYLTATEMQISPAKKVLEDFEPQPANFPSPAENPFAAVNNYWRLKATQKESPAEIRKRLQNHFHFWELYFNWALTNNIRSIDVRTMATPIKIYGNGFTLKPFDELPAEWKNYFYDAEDCQAASDKISYVLQHNLIGWPHTDNRYKAFIAVFQQLQSKLP